MSALFSIVFEDVEQRQSSKDPAAASAGAAWAPGDADEKIPQAWKLNLTGVKCCVGLEIRTRFHDASLYARLNSKGKFKMRFKFFYTNDNLN